MERHWSEWFQDKFENINEKVDILIESSTDKDIQWDPLDMVGHLKDILEALKQVEYKIDDLQYQVYQNKIQPSETEKQRMIDYEIEQKVISDIFPYMYCFYNYHKMLDKESK